MENVKINKIKPTDTKATILDAYITHILEHGKEPVSVFKFAKSINITEEEFYRFYTSFQGVKSGIWDRIFDQTVALMQAQEVYSSYSPREKLLSFYFTWIEVLKQNRSYLLALYEHSDGFRKAMPAELKSFRNKFKAFAKELIEEGIAIEQIADRKYIADKYEDGLWLGTAFIFQFWLRDTSTSFEKTDAAIEKSVKLAFDLMGRSAVDSFVDFAKFLYQSK